jgi:hypothetical protein
MGSLILLLLVIDRRARVVARVKALQEAARRASESEQTLAARRDEWEARRQRLHQELAQEEQEVLAQISTMKNKLSAVGGATQAEQARDRALHDRLLAEKTHLARWEQELTERRSRQSKQVEENEASRKEMARLTAELEQLERTLAELKAFRLRQQPTYSLVPYRGKHGDNRKPIYVECTPTGLVFHPDRLALPIFSQSPMIIRTEIERRLAARSGVTLTSGPGSTRNAYLLMLIRPDGITTYYRTLAALQGLPVDFGYEFVDRDWLLDFPADESAAGPQPWMVAQQTSDQSPASASARKVSGSRAVGPGMLTVADSTASNEGGPSGAGAGSASAGTYIPSSGARSNMAANERRGLPPPFGTPGDSQGSGFAQSTRGGSPSSIGFGASGVSMGVTPGRSLVPGGAVGPGGLPGRGVMFGGVASGNGAPSLLGDGSGQPSSGPGNGMAAGAGSGMTNARGVGTGNGTFPVSGGIGSPARPSAESEGGGTASTSGASGSATGRSIPPGQPARLDAPLALAPNRNTGSGTSGYPAAGNGGPGTGATGGQTQASTTGAQPSAEGAPAGGTGAAPPGLSVPQSTLPPAGATTNRGGGDSASAANATGSTGGVATTGAGSGDPGSTQGGESGPAEGQRGMAPTAVDALLPAPRRKGVRAMPLQAAQWSNNRDWHIAIDCTARALVITATGQRFAVAEVQADNRAFLSALQQMIERRQSTVAPGDVPYRPMIRFRVWPDGLRAYYVAYPALELLRVPMTREPIDPEEARAP